MTPEFQEDLLRFLFQDKSAKRYVDYLDSSVFDLGSWKILYKLWAKYVNKYHSVPSRVGFKEYFERIAANPKNGIKDEAYKELRNQIESVYLPAESDTEFFEDSIIEFAMKKRTRQLAVNMTDIDDADDQSYKKFFAEMQSIIRLKEKKDAFYKNSGGYTFRDHDKHKDEEYVKGYPFFLQAINKMTSAYGFHRPQSVCFMGGAKRFKTGLLVETAVDYAIQGLDVLFIDTENGVGEIRARVRQKVLAVRRGELRANRGAFGKIAKQIVAGGGEIVIHYLPPGSTLEDVHDVLSRYNEESGFFSNGGVIIHDYAHNYKPVDKTIKDRRLQVSDVYVNLPALNEKWNAFSFTVAPIGVDGNDKWVMTEKDFGEDKSIAYKVHASFAICRIDEEMKQGTAHIIPVVQRSGTSYKYNAETTCAIRINEELMQIEELDSEAYIAAMQPYINPGKKDRDNTISRPRKFRKPGELKDE